MASMAVSVMVNAAASIVTKYKVSVMANRNITAFVVTNRGGGSGVASSAAAYGRRVANEMA